MNYNMKNFYENISAACLNLEEVQKDFETLHLLNTKVLMKEEITKTYEELTKDFIDSFVNIMTKNYKDNIAFIEGIINGEK